MNSTGIKAKLVSLAAAAIAAIAVHADTETVDGYTWTYRSYGGVVEIYNGGYYGGAAISPLPEGSVTIPSTLGGRPVTSIGSYALYSCNGMTDVTIPDSVTSIGPYAFYSCSGLTSVTIPDSVTSIGGRAFSDCRGLTSVTIGNGVTSIASGTFNYCTNLTSVTIPSSITSIGKEAFSGCSGLTSFSVASDNPSYKEVSGLLLTKDGLTLVAVPGGLTGSLTIPDGVTSIGPYAFYSCSGLTSVTIPDSVTSIGDWAFSCCGLTSITIPNSVTSIGEHAFSESWGLADADGFIVVRGVLYSYGGESLEVTIPDGVTRIDTGVFDGMCGITSVTIPDSVTDIGASAFNGCDDLTNVTIGNGVTCIGESAFGSCWALKEILLPSSVTNIGDSAFHECVGLTSVVIPDSVVRMGSSAFEECTGLASVRLSESLTEIAGMAFEYCSSLTDVTIPDAVTVIDRYAFAYCKALTNVTIGKSIHKIYYGAFDDCPALTSVKYLGNANEIGTSDDSWYFGETSADCVVYAPVGATGFDTDEDGKWHGRKVIRYEPEATPTPIAPDPVNPDPVNPGYEVIEEKDITAPYAAPNAMVLSGVIYNGQEVVGIVELKLGKVKNGVGKISGSFTGLDGKKHNIKAVKLTGLDGTAPAVVSLDVKGVGTLTATIGGDKFAGSLGAWHVQSAEVGGVGNKAAATAGVAMDDLTAFPGTVLADLLPKAEALTISRGKWSFAKAASVKWAKPKKGAAPSKFYDEASGKDLIIDTSKGSNLSGLKLSYTPKKGTFKGSFKVYALEGAGAKTKLKKYTIKVSGVVVDGVGYGAATSKKPVLSWSVTVR